jgi:hypothetical protein
LYPGCEEGIIDTGSAYRCGPHLNLHQSMIQPLPQMLITQWLARMAGGHHRRPPVEHLMEIRQLLQIPYTRTLPLVNIPIHLSPFHCPSLLVLGFIQLPTTNYGTQPRSLHCGIACDEGVLAPSLIDVILCLGRVSFSTTQIVVSERAACMVRVLISSCKPFSLLPDFCIYF